MWFATENGLSRYDGRVFKNFTVQDGLPDNEVLKLFADSKGRVWIATFNKEICCISDNKIRNRANDSLIARLKFTNLVSSIAEDEFGNIGFSDDSKIVKIISYETRANIYTYSFPAIAALSSFITCKGKRISVGDAEFNSYLYESGKFNFFKSFKIIYDSKKTPAYFASAISCDGNTIKFISKKSNYTVLSASNNLLHFCNTLDGTWAVDTINNRWDQHYLSGKKITNTTVDTEKNLWFSTIGEGIYKLPSREIKTIRFLKTNGLANSEVFSISKYNGKIIAGLNHATVAYIENNKPSTVTYSTNSVNIMRPQTNRLYSIKNLTASNGIILGFDLFLLKIQNGKKQYGKVYPVKSVDEINHDFIAVGTSSYVFKMRLSDLQVTDTIWRERCTKIFYHDGKYYIGTLEGLYEVNEDKSYNFLGRLHPSLTRRVTDIKAAPDGTLWIATADEGLVVYKNGRVTAVLKETNGLSGNICKSLFLQQQVLWVGTNRGLSKINTALPSYPVTKYSSSDGLPSDIINAVYAEDSMVYVGSPAGLTVFNENKISASSVCRLNILDITVSGRPFDSLHRNLSYKTNNIRFSYTAVSLKSAGDITYYYRLQGINDDDWLQTNQAMVEYPALPGGNYEFNLYAVNKFGVKSNVITVRFSVEEPFWKASWFYVLFALLIAVAGGWIVNSRNKKHNRKLSEANALQKQFAGLEQQALQAQMNPHFIFNCLNGIQQYILTGDKENANRYLTGFARLIRQTLDNSGKRSVTVAQEVQYLTEYLEMEKMRAANTFSYTISDTTHNDAGHFEIPAMLLQPYVENAIRHGLRYKKDGHGMVEIVFAKEGNFLLCTIKDNGIGRAKSAVLKSSQHIEYQSKGMSLTARRIDLLNRINDTKMSVNINDLYTAGGQPSGTAVIIKIPVN